MDRTSKMIGAVPELKACAHGPPAERGVVASAYEGLYILPYAFFYLRPEFGPRNAVRRLNAAGNSFSWRCTHLSKAGSRRCYANALTAIHEDAAEWSRYNIINFPRVLLQAVTPADKII